MSLSAQISHNHCSINRLEHSLHQQHAKLQQHLTRAEMSTLNSLANRAESAETSKCKARQKMKFDRLRSWSTDLSTPPDDRWVVNLSSRTLDDSQLMVLRKGLNFAPAPSRVPIPRVIAAVEKGLVKLPDDQAEKVRKHMAGVLSRARPPPSNLPPEVLRALRSLRDLDDIFFLPADKGRVTVVIHREQYDAKIIELLSDERTYK